MKTDNEMLNSLLKRRAQYEIEQKRNRKRLYGAIASVGCVCIAALIGVGFMQINPSDKAPEKHAEDAIYQGLKDNFDENSGESAKNSAANNKIVINSVDSLSFERAKLNINLNLADIVQMDEAEICEYYGVDIFPTVPTDLKGIDEGPYNIYMRDGGTGEIYWDQIVLNYDNHDFSRGVNIEIKKGELPLLDYAFGDINPEKSVINNWETAIYGSEDGYMSALFMYKDVGFCVNARGLTQDEFIAVLSSVIK